MFWYAILALSYSGTNILCRSLTIHLRAKTGQHLSLASKATQEGCQRLYSL